MTHPTTTVLTRAQSLALSALRVHLGTQTPDTPTPYADATTLSDTLTLASAHKNLPLIYEGLFTLYPPTPDDAPQWSALMREYRRRTYADVIGQTSRTLSFLRLYETMHENGISPLVMKGIICRTLYPKPDHRPSSDEDLLVRPAQFAACEALFFSLGAKPLQPIADETEIPKERGYLFPDNLYIELHTALFAGDDGVTSADEARLFPALFSDTMTVWAEHTEIDTLSAQNHLLYLLLHAYKHFIHAGFGIRQVSDIALFAAAHAERIDFDRLYADCDSVRCARFAAAIFLVAKLHLSLSVPLSPAWETLLSAVDCMPLLCDILSGGIYGGTDGSRIHSASVTLDAARRGTAKGQSRSLLRTVFPDKNTLLPRYPYLAGKPYLLPAAWVQRILGYAKESAGSGSKNSAKESLRIAKARITLLSYYGIVDQTP